MERKILRWKTFEDFLQHILQFLGGKRFEHIINDIHFDRLVCERKLIMGRRDHNAGIQTGRAYFFAHFDPVHIRNVNV